MQHADHLLDLMEQTLDHPDAKALQSYLDLALSTQNGDLIANACNLLAPHVKNLKSLVAYRGGPEVDYGSTFIKEEDVLKFFQTLVGAIDQLMNKALVPREDYSVWSQRRSSIAAFVTRRRTQQRRSPRTQASATSGTPVDVSGEQEKHAEDVHSSTLEVDQGEEQESTETYTSKRQRPKSVAAMRRSERNLEEVAKTLQKRRESRQLRHFRHNQQRRELRPTGSWRPNKNSPAEYEHGDAFSDSPMV